jgi:hypothetical protein
LAAQGRAIAANPRPYQVDGEVGRFCFTTYRVINEPSVQGQTLPVELFPSQRGTEWYRTRGFKEIALMRGISEQSYRKTSELINRIRYQPEATSARTLQDNSEREGERILQQLSTQSQTILHEHQFSSEGVPQHNGTIYAEQSWHHLEAEVLEAAMAGCCQQVMAQDLQLADSPTDIVRQMQNNPVAYEDPKQSVNLSVDDVGVKQQKEQRHPATPDSDSTTESQRHYVYQTVIHIQHQQSGYVLNGIGWAKLFSWLVAFLVHNDLLHNNLIFFVDGQKTLHAAIQKAFAWFLPIQLILDWYHLEEKCKQQLSMALNGRQIRNEILSNLMPLLWHGLLDSALEYLRSLEPTLIKDADKLQQLMSYFERNRPFIPCYSVRKQLGLRNSSNIGEKYNDLLVSERQKHNGMSWSKAGSVALAAIKMLDRNKEFQTWFRTGQLNFKFSTT